MLFAIYTDLSPEQLLAGWLAELINVFIYSFIFVGPSVSYSPTKSVTSYSKIIFLINTIITG